MTIRDIMPGDHALIIQNSGVAVVQIQPALRVFQPFVCILAIISCQPAAAKPDDPDDVAEPAISSMLGTEAGDLRRDNSLKLTLVWCPSGKFKMGHPDSEANRPKDSGPQVDVTLTKGFWLGKFEVTQKQWESLMETTPWKGQAGVQVGPDYPATYVNFDDALEFCRKLTDRERNERRLDQGWEYTLPTEAQWEYACRASTTTRFSFGDDASELDQYAWYGRFYGEDGKQNEQGKLYAHEVGLKKPNPWGLHDVHGNVWEWCRDWYDAKPEGGTDPRGPENGTGRVLRGGSFGEQSLLSRSAARMSATVLQRRMGRLSFVGFRLACTQIQKK